MTTERKAISTLSDLAKLARTRVAFEGALHAVLHLLLPTWHRRRGLFTIITYITERFGLTSSAGKTHSRFTCPQLHRTDTGQQIPLPPCGLQRNIS